MTNHLIGERPERVPEQVYVNGVPHLVLEAVRDRYGTLVAIRRPKGHKVYAARLIEDTTYGEDRAYLVTPVAMARV